MADKKFSAKDVLEAVALPQGKQPSEFGLQSFDNKDGGFSVAVVNLATSSVVLQANDADEQACLNKLGNALEAGPVTHLDGAVAPKDNPTVGNEVGPGYGAAKTSVPHGTDVPAFKAPAPVRTLQEFQDELPKNDKGQVVIDENGFIEGLAPENQPFGAEVNGGVAEKGETPADDKSDAKA